MVLSRLPIAVAPAQQETVASYLDPPGQPARATAAGTVGTDQRSAPRWPAARRPRRPAGGRDRPPTRAPRPRAARAASRAGLVGAAPSAPARLPTLRRTTPRRSGDPPTAAPPLCLHPPPLLDRAAGHRPARHRPGRARRYRPCAATPPAAAGPPRSGCRLRRGADRVPVLRPPLGGSAGRRRRCSPRMDPPRRGPHPAGHRDGDVQRLPAVRGGLSRSRPPRRSHRLAHMATPCGR